MLSTKIKEATKEAHQKLEGVVIQKLKTIETSTDYAKFLKYFYTYFHSVEEAIAPYITADVLPDYKDRRNASYLKRDIEALGFTINPLANAPVAAITNIQEALGALYVLEGSIMGGSIIIKMLEKKGLTKGISFFSGYGAATGEKWATFTEVLNAFASTPEEEQHAIRAANTTFANFEKVFAQEDTEKVMV